MRLTARLARGRARLRERWRAGLASIISIQARCTARWLWLCCGAGLKSAKVKEALAGIKITVCYTQQGQRVLANGEDLTDFLRTPEATKGSSDIAVIPAVRLELVAIQRRVARQYDIVMDGRDIGTYVLPDAKAKFFVVASVKERARRRYLELKKNGVERPLEQLEAEIAARDKTDTEREFAPLRQAADAVLVDTTNMDIDEVVSFVMQKVKEAYPDDL